MPFDGDTYEPAADRVRLTTQFVDVWMLMRDSRWRSLHEITACTRGTEAAVSARLRDFRKARFGGHVVNRRHVGVRRDGYFEYQVVPTLRDVRLF